MLIGGQGCGARGVVITQGGWLGDHLVCKHFAIVIVGFPFPMWGFVVEHQEEWFVLGSGLEHADANVGDDVCCIAFVNLGAFGVVEDGVEIAALSGKNVPVVKACWIATEMPLAHHKSVITAVL